MLRTLQTDNSIDTSLCCWIVLQVTLIILKLLHVIKKPWLIVLSPIWGIPVGMLILVCVSVCRYEFKDMFRRIRDEY